MKMEEAALYEFISAAEVAVNEFRAAQERKGLEGLWFPVDQTYRHFCWKTSFKQEMLDQGYEGELWGDLGLIKAWANAMRSKGLYVAPRIALCLKKQTSVWLRRSMFVEHVESRSKLLGHAGARSQYSSDRMWSYWEK